MANFFSSLKRTLEIAQSTRQEQIEIDSVLNDLSEQVLEISSHKVKVALKEFALPFMEGSMAVTTILVPEKYQAIALVHNKFSGRMAPMAKWFQLAEGYPCQVTVKKVKHSCANKEALIEILKKMIEEPSFGVQLRDLMEFDSVTTQETFSSKVPSRTSAPVSNVGSTGSVPLGNAGSGESAPLDNGGSTGSVPIDSGISTGTRIIKANRAKALPQKKSK